MRSSKIPWPRDREAILAPTSLGIQSRIRGTLLNFKPLLHTTKTISLLLRHLHIVSSIFTLHLFGAALFATPTVSVSGENILLDSEPVKILGLRCSNALISDETTNDLIDALDAYQSYGLNLISVFMMGSRFGDVKGYLPNGEMDSVYRDRLERILKATQERGMMTIVGCLYWSTSKAKEDLTHWTQEDAEQAIANTASWLGKKGFHHVILDPDNEGMATRAMNWRAESFIRAAKATNPDLVVANNTRQDPPNEDLNMHFGKPEPGKPWFDSEATPKNAPGNYWGAYSKENHQSDETYYNYSRIGRYTEEMKAYQIEHTRIGMELYNGHVLASTWIQCSPNEGIDGPFTNPGGHSMLGENADKQADWNQDIDTIHPDAGIRWWLDYVKEHFK